VNRDPFFAVKALALHLADAFNRMFACGQRLDIDEQSMPPQV
jgi:hypothetical protein